jgi:peptide deformylase
MSALRIITLPDKRLRKRSTEVDLAFLLLPKTQQFIDDLVTRMNEDDGIGIAAPQVTIARRIIVIGKDAFKHTRNARQFPSADMVVVNPVLSDLSTAIATDQEGCLSVPGIFGDVRRHLHLNVEGMDRYGNALTFQASDFLARVFQHEVDHLNGVLFVDKATNIVHTPPSHEQRTI